VSDHPADCPCYDCHHARTQAKVDEYTASLRLPRPGPEESLMMRRMSNNDVLCLRAWLEGRERDIATGMEDCGILSGVFEAVMEREPSE